MEEVMLEKLIKVVEAKKDLEYQLERTKDSLVGLIKQNESLKKELLNENYKSYGVDDVNRFDFGSFMFGLNNKDSMRKAGIEIEEMVDYIREIDELKKAEAK